MPETHDLPELDLHIGPLRAYVHPIFVHRQKWPDPRMAAIRQPLLERATSAEDESPWRVGHGWAVRLPWTRWGAVIGYWDMPDPTREESVLWSGENGGMIPGVTYEQIKEWPGPEPDPDAELGDGIHVVDGREFYLVDGEEIELLPYAQGELVEDQLEALSGQPGVVEGPGDAPLDVHEVAPELADAVVGPEEQLVGVLVHDAPLGSAHLGVEGSLGDGPPDSVLPEEAH